MFLFIMLYLDNKTNKENEEAKRKKSYEKGFLICGGKIETTKWG
jgi:hypothetical protein